MKKLVILILSSFLILSCVSDPASGSGSSAQDPNRPEWTRGYPDAPGYYIGIGTSNTGNESEDRKIAEERARTNIAASISTKLHSETELYTREDSEGNLYNYAEEKVTAVVAQSLKGVESVDTYYSEAAGAWVYMRLSIALWEKTQREEMAALISRIKEFLTPVLNDYDRPLATKIKELVKARNLILESPYAGLLKTDLMAEEGSLIDLVDGQLKQHLDSVYMTIKPEKIAIEAGEAAEVAITFVTDKASRIGNLPFILTSDDKGTIVNSITDQAGGFSTEIKSDSLAMGQNYLTLSVNSESLGFDDSMRFLGLPEKEIIIDVQTVSIGLKVTLPEGIELYGMEGTVKSLFSARNLPFKIGNVDSPYIVFDIRVTDFPKYLEGAPDMAEASAVISLVRRGKTIYSFESQQFKDGGLTPEQAHQRSAEKLIEELKQNDEYVNGIIEALSLN